MYEVQDIFHQFGDAYKRAHKLPLYQLKAIHAIEVCRTAALGGHVDECDECGYERVSYNSCRNRHCPKCQGSLRERWIQARIEDLLPVPYFHVVFTLPNDLNPIALRNQRLMYSILFDAVSETMIELAKDRKYLGAQIGFTAILHTWGQNLMDHPHIHCIVPGGGLSPDGSRWIHTRDEFFIPVKVLSRKFRGKFMYYLKKAYRLNQLSFTGNIQPIGIPENFRHLKDLLYKKEWVVYCKKPFKSPEYVLEYLGRYTHRVAISNQRIVNIENGNVTFKWKDYRVCHKERLMTLTAQEFIRRFLMHIIPDKFVKIRHYGILSSRNRRSKLVKCKVLTGAQQSKQRDKSGTREMLQIITGMVRLVCPCCHTGRLFTKTFLDRQVQRIFDTG
jgi:hypothetical protein